MQTIVYAEQMLKLPSAVAKAIFDGERPLRAIRKWRGLTQAELGDEKTTIGQSTVAALESGRRHGTADQWRQLARARRLARPADRRMIAFGSQ